jgi:Ca-activated chloride channel family protein
VLITDGEDLQGDALDAATKAAEKGMTIYTVGVGSSEGELIPITNNGKTEFVKDASGKFITSRLDESGLTKIAEVTSGLYVPLGVSGEGLQTIYQEKLALIPKEDLAEKRHKVPLERFVWPLGAALILLMLEFLASGRKSQRSLRLPFIKTAGRRTQKAAAILFFCLLLPSAYSAEASVGETAYEAGDYLGAATYYSEQLEKAPDDARLQYNYGTAAFKNNLFEDAAESFSKALKSDDIALQEQAYYNRGNALYQLGTESLQTDKQHSIKLWEEAAKSFDGALQLNSMNDDAGFNLAFVQKKLEELKKQQEQEKQDQKDQEKNDEQNDQDQKEDQSQDPNKNKDGNQGQDQKQGENKQESDKTDAQNTEQEKDSSEKKSDVEKDKKQQEQAGTEEKDETQEKSQEAQAGEKEQQEQQAEEARQRAAARREQGKMTDEEAMQLLNSLKDEEGELNFVPAAGQRNTDNQRIIKDW